MGKRSDDACVVLAVHSSSTPSRFTSANFQGPNGPCVQGHTTGIKCGSQPRNNAKQPCLWATTTDDNMGSDVVVMHAVVSWNSGCADSIAFLTGRRRICLGITNSSEMQPFEVGRSSFEDGAGRSCQQGGTHDCESKPWDRHVAIVHHSKSQEHHIIGQHGISARNVFSRASCMRGTTLASALLLAFLLWAATFMAQMMWVYYPEDHSRVQ